MTWRSPLLAPTWLAVAISSARENWRRRCSALMARSWPVASGWFMGSRLIPAREAAIQRDEGEYSVNIVCGHVDFSPPAGVSPRHGMDYAGGIVPGVTAMTYLVADDLPTMPAGERFRALLARPGILRMPGAHNGQAALQAKRSEEHTS